MVSIYNKNKSPEEAVPVDKIIQITHDYQQGMKEVHTEYNTLSGQLKKEEEERDAMMGQIQVCFEKLERMEKIMKQRKAQETHLKNSSAEKGGATSEAK